MGTSSIYNGKNDRNPLLPDDYMDEENNEDMKNTTVKWQTVKTNMSKFINSGGNSGSVSHIVKQYIKASGGSSRLASQSISGISTGITLGTFLNGIRNSGFEITFKNLGIQYIGKSVQDVFSQLINIISLASDTKEDIVAKEAAQQALSKVYDYIEINEMNLEYLDSMSPALMNEVLCEYVSSYIWTLIMKDLTSRFEIYIDNPKQTLSFEKEFKDYIASTVKIEFESEGDIINQGVSTSISNLYEKCLKVLEGTL
ncbi:hypothetical protein ACR77J_11525 [Tissierella praeacuta]|uniref:hypothetical protein n=1 Tax=Tissierella praeacuta TaxID=43131 RepID=UPI003DA6B845